ncbi:MAG: NAD-dependent malic enzyme [Acidimicrobiia bacterium]|nr:NAD-dependent malic enzyme [Acidimicrobiia bacterium]
MASLGFRPEIDPDTGESYLAVEQRGVDLLKNPLLNKGTAFSESERDDFGLWGLLPAHVSSIDEQVDRFMEQYSLKTTDLGRNIELNGLLDANETLFYRVVSENLEALVPIIYTPTVAAACARWSRIFRRSRGIYITPRDRGRMVDVLRSRPKWPRPVIVVTDNERILGIGDQGAGGMGIPIGKLALYAAAAGIHPARLVPISLDVGTENEELLDDPLYLGWRQRRLRGDEYDAFIAEFVDAVKEAYPGALLQWEDFANLTSFKNLETYRHDVLSFNDDIQGTAAMVVAGLLAATRHIGGKLTDHRVVVVGAGSAGIGIRDQVAAAMVAEGADPDVAAGRIFVLDSRGLIVEGRPDLSAAKQRLAVPTAAITNWQISDHPIGLSDVVRNARASVLIGVSGVAGIFNQEIVARMARYVDRPIIMPLSNPTTHAEVTPENALAWTGGRAVVATGSPFPAVTHRDRTHHIGQANNVFVFPGMGLGALAVGAGEVTERMFLAAARALAGTVGDEMLSTGRIVPPITEAPEASLVVARAVAEQAVRDGVAEPSEDLEAQIHAAHWTPEYLPYRPA